MIAIVNYGLGNIRAFVNLYERLRIAVTVVETAEQLKGASKVILPGVGAFDRAMILLDKSGMRGMLDTMALDRGIPILGVCVGMQIMAHSSEEGKLPGLGWIDGSVRKLGGKVNNTEVQLPHMGWNTIAARRSSPLISTLSSRSRFYFLHSYCFECGNEGDSVARTEYFRGFTSIVNSMNIYGVQFHPEKSHLAGIQLLKNFAEF